MLVALSVAALAGQIVQLDGAGSRCVVYQQPAGRNAPAPIVVRCNGRRTALDIGRHDDVRATKLGPCHALIKVEAERRPRLYSVDNCGGRLHSSNLGRAWEADLMRKAGIAAAQVEQAAYDPKAESLGCYIVTLSYGAETVSGDYCASPIP